MYPPILVSIAEIGRSALIMGLQHLLTPIGLGILPLEVQVNETDEGDSNETAGDASPHTRLVPRELVLLAEHQTTRNTAKTTKADKSGAAESSLPLAADVVGLEGHDSWDVAVGTGGDEEDAEVADVGIRSPAHDGESDEAEKHVEEDHGASDVILVTDPGSREHDNTSKGIRRRNETLSCSDTEAHVSDEDDGEGVSKGVADSGGIEEDHSIGPDLPVGTASNELAKLEGRDLGVATITADTIDDPLTLTTTEERPCLALGVGEVDEEPVSSNTEGDGESTFDDENPAPASEILATVELHETIGENTRESRSDATEKIEDRVSLSDLISSVPCAEKIDTAGEETSLEETKNRSESCKLRELLDESHANHDSTPHHSDKSKMNTRTDFADEDSRRRLKDDVGDEEDQVGDVVSEASELQLNTHARNVGSTHIGSIHKRNTIHSTNSHDESTINASNDAALLLLREAMVVIDLRADLARSLIEMIELGLLLDAVVTIGCSIHGCVGSEKW